MQKTDKYYDLLKRLYSLPHGKIKKSDLTGMCHLSALYQHPHRQFLTIHVAGSNGKGSVSAKVSKGLQALYKKVGLFTSPHISCFRERIQVNGEKISEADSTRLLNEIISLPGTFFELTTLLAFRYFAEKGVDAAVIETGLGGRLDSTNIITPILSIITSISLEHTAILGNTLEEIAEEKKGIVKPGIPVVLGPRAGHLIASSISNSPVYCVQEPPSGFSTVDEENRAIAKQALELLAVPPKAIQKALTTKLPCRLEKIFYKDQEIILDVAHNPDGLRRLFKELTEDKPTKFIVVCGFSTSKDVEVCLNTIASYAKEIHLVCAKGVKGVPVEKLKEILINLKGNVPVDHIFCHTSIEKGLWSAINTNRNKKSSCQVIVTGTFFIMSEARRFLGIQELSDVSVS